jgi:hypothetical protein
MWAGIPQIKGRSIFQLNGGWYDEYQIGTSSQNGVKEIIKWLPKPLIIGFHSGFTISRKDQDDMADLCFPH